MVTAANVRARFQLSQSKFEYYERERIFNSEIAPTRRGKDRPVTSENALEIGLLTAVVDSGAAPREAKRIVFDLMRRLAAGEDIAVFVFEPAAVTAGRGQRYLNSRSIESVTVLDAITTGGLAAGGWTADRTSHATSKSAFAVGMVNVVGIVAEVDAMFAEPAGAA